MTATPFSIILIAMNWNPQQQAIFDAFKTGRSNFVVVARAGAGKTTTIRHGIGLAPEKKKCYVVFNTKNKVEAKERIDRPDTKVYSLNGLGHCFVGMKWGDVVPDENIDNIRLMQVGSSCGVKNPPKLASTVLSFAKSTAPFAKEPADIVNMMVARGLLPTQKDEIRGWKLLKTAEVVAKTLEVSRRKSSRISYDDQIWLPVVENMTFPWFDLLVVDEAQDLNYTQTLMIRRSYKPSGRLVLVGDPSQAIYGFRGSDSGSMERIAKEVKAKEYHLQTTQRCAKEIVKLAQKLVPDIVARDDAPEGTITTIRESNLVESLQQTDVVLSRTNAPLISLCAELVRCGKPAYVEGKDFAEILMAVNNSVFDPDPDTYFVNLHQWRGPRKGTGASDDIYDVLRSLSAQYGPGRINSVLPPLFQQGPGKILLSTIHKAKGLEWDRVHLMSQTLKTTWDRANSEENNIAYVGVTRARTHLVLVE